MTAMLQVPSEGALVECGEGRASQWIVLLVTHLIMTEKRPMVRK